MSRNTQWKVAGFGVSALVLVTALFFASGTQEVPGSLLPEASDPDAFAQQALEALRAADPTGELKYDPERFLIQRYAPDGGLGMSLFLANFHREYQDAPPERRVAVLARLGRAGVLPEAPATYAQARPYLRLVIRARDTFEQFSQQTGESAPVSWRPVGEVLAEALVQDTPDAMRYVPVEELTRWGITYEQARADAMANLRRMDTVPLRQLTLGACALFTNDSYAASRLLLEDVVRGCEVKGEPVVVVPNRDTLLITGSEDATGLLTVAEAALEGIRAPRPVDGHALRLTADGWKPFLPGAESPSRSILEHLAFASRMRGYQEQTERLRQQHEQEHSEVFVAGFIPEKDARGRFFSQTVWSNDGESLLPRADVILFVDAALGPDAPPVASVRWDLVVRDAGTLLMPELGMYPERYRVTGFPSKEQLQRWKADSTAMDVP
ncbi:DUF1444 family protein [Corallococcus aberystwythensis]|uniref:DUF1444 family protein n=1 Tax=Corallococcus aberystwythensis TaxID=2316722 RepID=A0A3A8Q879_9BACT|nr:DUF1444 family protein [Corallococcus aberystwythensis]RKH64388.1 DUF1444 family protein [Corallococcus aberystwythensis]